MKLLLRNICLPVAGFTIEVDAELASPQRRRIQAIKRDVFGTTLKSVRIHRRMNNEETSHDLAIHSSAQRDRRFN